MSCLAGLTALTLIRHWMPGTWRPSRWSPPWPPFPHPPACLTYNLLYELNIQFPGLWFDMGWTHLFPELALCRVSSLVFSKQEPWLNVGSYLMSPPPGGKWDSIYSPKDSAEWFLLFLFQAFVWNIQRHAHRMSRANGKECRNLKETLTIELREE